MNLPFPHVVGGAYSGVREVMNQRGCFEGRVACWVTQSR